MLKPCAVCQAEAVHNIFVQSCSEGPMGEFWFCTYDHLIVWLTRFVSKEKEGGNMKDEIPKAAAAAAAVPLTADAPQEITVDRPPVRFDHLRKLEHGWNGEDAPAPTPESIAMAERIASITPQATPTTDGGVQLDWISGFELTVASDGSRDWNF
jgi:hypothetical protein